MSVSDARASLQTSLRVTEIMYHPTAGNDSLEYIELTWGGTSSVDLNGVEFTYGIGFAFFGGQTLDPGESLVVVRSISAFESHYGTGFNIAGEYAVSTMPASEFNSSDLSTKSSTTSNSPMTGIRRQTAAGIRSNFADSTRHRPR